MILLAEVTNLHIFTLGNFIHFRVVVVNQLLSFVFDISDVSVQVFDFVLALETSQGIVRLGDTDLDIFITSGIPISSLFFDAILVGALNFNFFWPVPTQTKTTFTDSRC